MMMLKRKLLLAGQILGAMFGTLSAKEVKVLMIGNSFSICVGRNLPQIVHSFPEHRLKLTSAYIGGCPMERHWNNIKAAETNADFRPYMYDRNVCGKSVARNERRNIPDAIAEAKWDIVTVQQASGKSCFAESYVPYGDDLVEYVRRHAPQAKIVVQETWSYTPWDKRL